MKLTPSLVNQARRVSELLDEGYTNRRIAEILGVSSPRISQIRQQLPQLEGYLGAPAPTERLRGHREQLRNLRREALNLARQIAADIRTLDEELESAEIDQLLGLRTG